MKEKNTLERALQFLMYFSVLFTLNIIFTYDTNAQLLKSVWENNGVSGTGYSVAQAKDINGDGYGDMVIGNPYYSNGQINEGKISVFYGSSSGFDLTANWSAESNQDSAYLGWSLVGMCDINGDGYSDIVAGAPGTAGKEGKIYVYYGSSTGLGSTAVTRSESQQGERFGYAVAAQDINNDGYSEIFAGAPYYNGGSTAGGRVCAYIGSASGISSSSVWNITGNGQYSGFGWSIAVGSITKRIASNRKYNLIIGAPSTNTSGNSSVVITDLLDDLNPPAKIHTLNDSTTSSRFGHSIAIAGDINRDGYEDIIIGAPYYSNGQSQEGRVTIYTGDSSIISQVWSAEGNQIGANFGSAVAGKGRINNDTLDDIAITAPGSDSTIKCLAIYNGTTTGISSIRRSVNIKEKFSSVAFFCEPDSIQGGIITGAPFTILNGQQGNTNFIREFETALKREGVTQDYITIRENSTKEISVSVNIYPNPITDYLNIAISSVLPLSGDIQIELISTVGTVILKPNAMHVKGQSGVQSLAIKIPSLPNGVYYVAIHVENQTIYKQFQISQ